MAGRIRGTPVWLEIQALHGRGEMVAAMERLKALAATGDEAAPAEIAHLYELGIGGIKRDMAEAISWYERAQSKFHDANACLALGRIYMGSDQYEKALPYFEQCAETEPGAQFALGLMHNLGCGVPKDLGKAIRFYVAAAQRGHLLARKNLGVAEMQVGHLLKGLWHYASAIVQMIPVALRNREDPRIRIA